MNPEQLKEMQEITWWHKMDLDGVKTRGEDFTMEKLATIKLPANLKGKTVIDIGAWDGFFSFECERRGADVLAVDSINHKWKEGVTWKANERAELYHSGKKGFNFARKILNSKVKDKEMEVMDLKGIGEFDLVLCLGILYHMEDPFGMCKVMYDITKKGGLLILETHSDLKEVKRPALAFYPDGKLIFDSNDPDSYVDDPTTYFGPNPPAVESMLKAAGFKDIQQVSEYNQFHRICFHARK